MPSGCVAHSNSNRYQWNTAANGAVAKWWLPVCMMETVATPTAPPSTFLAPSAPPTTAVSQDDTCLNLVHTDFPNLSQSFNSQAEACWGLYTPVSPAKTFNDKIFTQDRGNCWAYQINASRNEYRFVLKPYTDADAQLYADPSSSSWGMGNFYETAAATGDLLDGAQCENGAGFDGSIPDAWHSRHDNPKWASLRAEVYQKMCSRGDAPPAATAFGTGTVRSGECLENEWIDATCECGGGYGYNACYSDRCCHACPAAKYDLRAGATCAEGYKPLTSSWQDCEEAARSMGFVGDSVNFVEYDYPWGTERPQGCFRSDGNNRFHFNRGAGGDFKGNDRILCIRKGKITAEPTVLPTAQPTAIPTAEPTAIPTAEPTDMPTSIPSAQPTAFPTDRPTMEPSTCDWLYDRVTELAKEVAELRLENRALKTRLAKYDLRAGATCAEGYKPITSSWQDCEEAARSMGFVGDPVNFVEYDYPWGTKRPQGCFRSDGNNR